MPAASVQSPESASWRQEDQKMKIILGYKHMQRYMRPRFNKRMEVGFLAAEEAGG